MDIQDIMNYIKEAVEMKHRIDYHETTSHDKAAIHCIVGNFEDLSLVIVKNSSNLGGN